MMVTLNLFPARVAIGTANVAGTEVPVLMTPEFFRALSDLLQRVGGPTGTATGDIEEMAIQSLTPVVDMSAFIGIDALQSVESTAAANMAMQAANDALAVQIEQAGALLADLRRRCDDLDVMAGYQDPYRVDWEHPGTIGSITANTGKFTSITATGAFGCNGKAAQTAFALGAAATDLPTVITLANNMRTALINNGIGS